MRWIDILSGSLSNLFRRKLRSALTMAGVVIGTAAIIVTMSLGYGAEQTQMEMLQSYSNLRLLTVSPYYSRYDYDGESDGTNRRLTKITDSVIRQLRKMDGVTAVTPVAQIYGSINFNLETGKYKTYANLMAVDPKDFAKIVDLKEGEYFTNRTDRMEFIMSELSMSEFTDPKKPDEAIDAWEYMMNGQDIPLPDINFLKAKYNLVLEWEDPDDTDTTSDEPKMITREEKAVMRGYMKADYEDSSFQNFGYYTIVNINWYKQLYKDNRKLFKELQMPDISNYDTVYVLADDVDNVRQLVKDLTEFGVQCYSPLEYVDMMQGQIRTMQVFMGFIGAISLFVAALSIANTMMMSIYERTREIGVMKVLGCKLGNIRLMFLSEAAFIGLIGGLAGVLLSYGLSYALNNVPALQEAVASVMSGVSYMTEGGTASIIPAQLSMSTWGFVVLIAIGSGVYPAHRAMHLSSLAAIRSAD